MEYRRLKHRDTWHFSISCQHWRRMTAGRYVSIETEGRPTSGELCDECRAKAAKERNAT